MSTLSAKRKRLYQCYIRDEYGQLGWGNRRRVPKCVKAYIRGLLPSPNGCYMGHRDGPFHQYGGGGDGYSLF